MLLRDPTNQLLFKRIFIQHCVNQRLLEGSCFKTSHPHFCHLFAQESFLVDIYFRNTHGFFFFLFFFLNELLVALKAINLFGSLSSFVGILFLASSFFFTVAKKGSIMLPLLISCLQSPCAVILELPQNKVCHCFHCFPIYLP